MFTKKKLLNSTYLLYGDLIRLWFELLPAADKKQVSIRQENIILGEKKTLR